MRSEAHRTPDGGSVTVRPSGDSRPGRAVADDAVEWVDPRFAAVELVQVDVAATDAGLAVLDEFGRAVLEKDVLAEAAVVGAVPQRGFRRRRVRHQDQGAGGHVADLLAGP